MSILNCSRLKVWGFNVITRSGENARGTFYSQVPLELLTESWARENYRVNVLFLRKNQMKVCYMYYLGWVTFGLERADLFWPHNISGRFVRRLQHTCCLWKFGRLCQVFFELGNDIYDFKRVYWGLEREFHAGQRVQELNLWCAFFKTSWTLEQQHTVVISPKTLEMYVCCL